ncbi:hypothetical protein KR044_011519 [Drosophila immigrans]|nr:hypothetical protein KR044_011519 [Drosophila immigrans]
MCKLQLLFRLFCLPLVFGSGTLPSVGYLASHMHPEIDPCVDFYEHACGGWGQAHKSDDHYSQLELLDHDYKSRLIAMLQRDRVEQEPRFVALLRDNYKSCRRQRVRFKAAQLVRFLLQWSNTEMQAEVHVGRQSKLLSWLKAEHRLQLLPHHKSTSDADQAAIQWLRQVSTSWASTSESDVAEFLPLTQAQFRRLYRQLQPLWLPQQQLWPQIEQLELQLSRLPEDVAGKPLASHKFPDYWLLPLPLQRESKLMLDTHWRRYKQRLPGILATESLSVLLHYALLRLLHKLQLREAPQFTRHECATQTHELLPHAAVWLVQQQQTPSERQLAQDTLQQLFEQLRQRFERKLRRNRNQFAEPEQLYLLDKLQRMRLRVSVLPGGDVAAERTLLETHYARLQLNANDYFGNLLAILQQLELWQLQQDRLEADAHNATAAAAAAALHLLQPDGYGSYASPYFMPGRNLVMVPHSLLAPPIYGARQAAVLTQSALGFLIGHEMSHGFSPTDVIFDGRGKRGSRQQERSLRANHAFGRQTHCLHSRYEDMADEKFCDMNGLSLAFEAFGATSAASNKSLQQLFFLNMAQFFCQKAELLENSVVHGSSRQRINDAVSSLEAFNSAFSCNWRPRHDCQLY